MFIIKESAKCYVNLNVARSSMFSIFKHSCEFRSENNIVQYGNMLDYAFNHFVSSQVTTGTGFSSLVGNGFQRPFKGVLYGNLGIFFARRAVLC